MRKIFIFSACILTLGAAVVVGSVFARLSVPGGAAVSGLTRVPGTVNTYAIADNPQARQSPANANQYGSSLPAPLAQAQPGQGYPAHSPPTPPTGIWTAPPSVPSFHQPASTPQSVSSGFDPYNKRTEGNYFFGEAPRQTLENGSAIGSPGQPMKVEFRHRMIPDPNNPGQQIEVSYAQMVPVDGPVDRSEPLDESSQQIANLLRELREAQESSPNPEKLQMLRKLVAEQFDKRHKSQVARLESIQAELQRTQEILDRRNGQRDEIIERRVAQLLGEQDPLRWDYQPAVPQLSSPYQGYPTPRSATPTTSPGVPLSRPPLPQFTYPNITYGAGDVYYPGPYPPQLPRNSSEDEAVQAAENDARRARAAADALQRRANSLRMSAQGSIAPAQSLDTIPAVEPEATEDNPPPVESPPSPRERM